MKGQELIYALNRAKREQEERRERQEYLEKKRIYNESRNPWHIERVKQGQTGWFR